MLLPTMMFQQQYHMVIVYHNEMYHIEIMVVTTEGITCLQVTNCFLFV
jgi:hypothetical protein